MKKQWLFLISVIATGLLSCSNPRNEKERVIAENETRLINDTTRLLNTRIAEMQLELYLSFVTDYPADSLSPVYLFKAADLAQGLRKPKEAISLYKKLISDYPDHPKAGSSLFLQAFIYDNAVRNKDSARILYNQFLEKYPEHSLAPSAKASVEQIDLGLSDEEMIKMFESRMDSTQQPASLSGRK